MAAPGLPTTPSQANMVRSMSVDLPTTPPCGMQHSSSEPRIQSDQPCVTPGAASPSAGSRSVGHLSVTQRSRSALDLHLLMRGGCGVRGAPFLIRGSSAIDAFYAYPFRTQTLTAPDIFSTERERERERDRERESDGERKGGRESIHMPICDTLLVSTV